MMMSMLWSIADVADAVQRGLEARAAEDHLEQSVRGFDVLDEVALHPTIQNALRDAGYGVFPEQRFPSDRMKRKKSEGKRCDIVLTLDAQPLAEPDAEATLFQAEDSVDLQDAFWLEVKVVSQFDEEGPNRRYAAELMEPVRKDVAKLAKDDQILHGAVLLVIFATNEAVSEHDVAMWHQKCMEKGYPTGTPYIRHIKIADRIGHSICTACIFPVYHL